MSSTVLRVTTTRTAVVSALALGVLAVGGVTSAALADGAQPAVTPAAQPAVPTPVTTPGPVPAEVTAVPVPASDGPTGTIHVDAGGGSTGDDTVWLVLGGTGAVLAAAGAGLGLTRRRA